MYPYLPTKNFKTLPSTKAKPILQKKAHDKRYSAAIAQCGPPVIGFYKKYQLTSNIDKYSKKHALTINIIKTQ